MILGSILCQSIYGQGNYCPPNLGFENGNLAGWGFYVGSCCPITANTKTNPINGRHTLMNGSNVDTYGDFPVVAPGAGKYSFKLGNSKPGAQAERARYTLRIPSDNFEFKVLLHYAVVLEDFGHISEKQPRFEVLATDSSNNNTISCSSFGFTASSNLPGFRKSAKSDIIWYKPWAQLIMDFSGLQGKTIILDFSTADCEESGHFGYAYFDLVCDREFVRGARCKQDSLLTLTAPLGFKTYRWFDSAYSIVLGNESVLNQQARMGHTVYHVAVTPHFGYGCPDTLTKIVNTSHLSIEYYTADTNICKNTSVLLKGNATDDWPFLPIESKWRRVSNGDLCLDCDSVEISGQRNDTFQFVVKNNEGCTDSAQTILRIFSYPKIPGFIANDTVCEGAGKTFAPVNNIDPDFRYQWYKDNHAIPGANSSSLFIPTVTCNDSGQYQLEVLGKCDTTTSNIATLNVNPKPVAASKRFSPETCINSQDIVLWDSSNCYDAEYTVNWLTSEGQSSQTDPFVPLFKLPGKHSVFQFITTNESCKDTAALELIVRPAPEADFEIKDSVNGLPVFLNTSKNAQHYFWDFGNGRHLYTSSKVPNLNPNYGISINAQYQVLLVATDSFGCSDSQTRMVIFHNAIVYVPNAVITRENAITPLLIPSCYQCKKYTLSVYNRWGEKIYESGRDEIFPVWDCNYLGNPVSPGSYVYILDATDMRSKLQRFTGTVTILH